MDIEFVANDYLLAWCLLFKPSVSEDVQKLKEKLYKVHAKKYLAMEKEKVEILKYTEDFIPDDDTIYNIIFETDIFKITKKETEKYRQFLLKEYGQNQKAISATLNDLLRCQVKNKFKILVVHPKLETIEFLKTNPMKNVIWGKSEDLEDGTKTIIRILFTLLKYEIGDFEKENTEIVSAIIDLTISNELYTRITSGSKYEEGLKKLKLLKRQIYPYWLMYLGADREELVSYMMRDRIPFDLDKYPVEKTLRKCDLYGFIEFCCRNQRHIIRLDNLDIV